MRSRVVVGVLGVLWAGAAAAEPPAKDVVKVPSLEAVKHKKWIAFGGTFFRMVAEAKTGAQPKGVCITPDGKNVYTTNFGDHDKSNVYRFDAVTLERKVKSSFPGNAVECVTSKDSKTVFVSNFYHAEMLALDAETLEVKKRYPVQNVPKHFAFSPDEKTLYASNWESASESVVDLTTGENKKNIKVGLHPRGVAVTHDGKKIYVTNAGEQYNKESESPGLTALGKSFSVSVIDAKTLEVTKTIQNPCKAPRHAAITSDDKLLIASCLGSHVVGVIDIATDTVLRKVDVGPGPKTIEISKDGKFAYTANYRGSSLSIVDLTTWKSITVPLPIVKGSGLTVSPDDRRIYVTGWDTDNLVVVERQLP
jgi:YVTN family beta-propeller protein